ncbi:MAG: PAS domain S-box protein [Myxococcota bacterium]|jgi:PAS domain S-box-containing protein|nr:PAS domain S-box protein [Myxococcota bacterium]
MSAHEPNDSPAPLAQLERTVRENMPPPRRGANIPSLPRRTDRLLEALDAMGVWVSEVNDQGTITYTSDQVEVILGITAEECVAEQKLEFHPDDLSKVIESGRKVRSTGRHAHNQTRLRHKDGHWVWVANTLIGWTDDHGRFATLIYARDISDVKQAEAAHRESEARYSVVSQMSCDLITEMNADGRYTYIGPGAEALLGYEEQEVLELEPWALLHPDERERVRAQLEKQLVPPTAPPGAHTNLQPIEARLRHKDGRWLWFEIQGVTYPRADGETRYLAVNRDVTERVLAEKARREFEQSMQRAQKLESLGVLAGGIAHDFNNLLTPIMGATGLALMELPNDSPVRSRLQTIHRAAKRAAALTNQMLAYAGQKPLRVEWVDLTAIVEDMRDLASTSLAGKARIDLKLEKDLPFVEGESAQLSQVVMNLISNAAESLPEEQGQLSISTGTTNIDSRSRKMLFCDSMPPGEYVYFEVRDNGCGMDAETLDRIFDPFYTTKFTGRGLGLAAVSGIVRGHGGGIEVTSEPGVGTCFRVLFPAVHPEQVQQAHQAEAPGEFCLEGTALVVDDDEGVRELAQEVLERAGMRVLCAADGRAGVDYFRDNADQIRVVLLDRTMPELSGADTLEAIRKICPNTPIVLVSGYSEERVQDELGGKGLAGFLKKPFLPENLLERVAEVLRP